MWSCPRLLAVLSQLSPDRIAELPEHLGERRAVESDAARGGHDEMDEALFVELPGSVLSVVGDLERADHVAGSRDRRHGIGRGNEVGYGDGRDVGLVWPW